MFAIIVFGAVHLRDKGKAGRSAPFRKGQRDLERLGGLSRLTREALSKEVDLARTTSSVDFSGSFQIPALTVMTSLQASVFLCVAIPSVLFLFLGHPSNLAGPQHRLCAHPKMSHPLCLVL